MGIKVREFELQVNSFCCCALAMEESDDITVSAQLVTLMKNDSAFHGHKELVSVRSLKNIMTFKDVIVQWICYSAVDRL